MAKATQNSIPRAAIRNRRQEIEQCLAEFGLSGGPRRTLPGLEPQEEDDFCSRLRAALTRLGPVFASFGIYLSSRVDLLRASDCLELAAIPDRAEKLAFPAVLELVEGEIGRSPSEVYSDFEEEPFESSIMHQSHSARLSDGTPVTLRILRPDLDGLACDLELLPLLEGALAGDPRTKLPIEEVSADFRRALQMRTDLVREAQSLELLSRDCGENHSLGAPRPYGNLCTARLLTYERLPGPTFSTLIASLEGPETGGSTIVEGGSDSRDLASLLCFVWLRQAFLGSLFPVEPGPESIVLGPNNQIAFTRGAFATLPPAARSNLLEYLVAASSQDPDRACHCLLREMKEDKLAIKRDELRSLFRQIAPIRDGGWGYVGRDNSLCELLFLQWRLATSAGYQPAPHLVSFYRGLFLTADTCRRLTPESTPMAEGLENLRLTMALGQFQGMIGFGQLRDNIDKYFAVMMELPGKLDQVLTLGAEGKVRVKIELDGAGERRRGNESSAALVALLLLMAALSILAHRLAGSTAYGGLIDSVGGVLFVILSAMLLRTVSRTR